MMSLEEIFLKQAVNLDSRIDSIQLRQLLRLENGKCFDSQLCDELVVHFGQCNTINFSDFEEIWSLLKKRRMDFDEFSYNGQLCSASFQMLLEQIVHKQLPTDFVQKLVHFYGKQITFDVFVHAVHHVKIIIATEIPLCADILMKRFRESIRTSTNSEIIVTDIQPSAPPEEILPNRYCTYI